MSTNIEDLVTFLFTITTDKNLRTQNKTLPMANPGAKAGFFAGIVYSLVLTAISLFFILQMSFEEFVALISPYASLQPELMRTIYLIVLNLSPIAVFIYALIVSTIFGIIYDWLAKKVGKEWESLLAITIGVIVAVILGLTINLPVSKTIFLVATTTASLSYSIPLFSLYRRYSLKFDPSWISALNPLERDVIRLLNRKKLKFLDIESQLKLRKEELSSILDKLMEEEYVDIDYENRYFLTAKGRLCARNLT